MTPNEFEYILSNLNSKELIYYLMNNKFLIKEMNSNNCNSSFKLIKYKRCIDKMAWGFMNRNCSNYKKYHSISYNSFLMFQH